jgi:hypothetical protein
VKIIIDILSTLYLIIGLSSILALNIIYFNIIFKHRKLMAVFSFWEYATPKQLKIIKTALKGLVVVAIIFITIVIIDTGN